MAIIDTTIPFENRNKRRLFKVATVLGLFIALAFAILLNENSGIWTGLAYGLLIGCALRTGYEILIFSQQSNATDSWKIYLDQHVFRWQSPKHYLNKESGFELKLNDIEKIETKIATENSNRDQFWIYPINGKPIRLMDYSGFNLISIFTELEKLGVRTATNYHRVSDAVKVAMKSERGVTRTIINPERHSEAN